MKKKKGFLITTIMSLGVMGALIAVTMNACNKPSSTAPILPGNEFLTTTLLVLSTAGQPTDTLIWSEIPTTQTVPDTVRSFATLLPYTTYNYQIIILDSTQNPDSAAFVVSNEIIARENYHLFCFYDSTNENDIYGTALSSRGPSGWVNVLVDDPNYDNNKPPLPFGLTGQLVTSGASKGQLEVILRHQPDVKNGDCAPGSTDLDVYYNITVK